MSRTKHGGLDFAELESLGLDPTEVIDFSASVNPLGASPRVLDTIREVDPSTYPDPTCRRLRHALAGNWEFRRGASWWATDLPSSSTCWRESCLRPGDLACVFGPTFVEYEAAIRLEGAEPMMLHPARRSGFRWEMDRAVRSLSEARPSLTFLCNPNNPTGVYLEQEEVQAVAGAVGRAGLLVLDEAYVAFVDRPWDATGLLTAGNVVLLRSMTKDYGLPGLRLGYLLASPRLIERVARLQYSWSVNALAQAAGLAALEDPDDVRAGRHVVRSSREYLVRELRRMGLACSHPSANHLLVEVGDASAVRRQLLERHRLCVRDCASFGLPRHIRIGLRPLDDTRRLVKALSQVLPVPQS